MGQYHYLVNLDRGEFVNPHALGDGLKAWEQWANAGPLSTAGAALYLMVAPEPRGGGDLIEGPYMGRWHGDRVIWAGDYAERGDYVPSNRPLRFKGPIIVHPDEVYDLCSSSGEFKDISEGLLEAMRGEEMPANPTRDYLSNQGKRVYEYELEATDYDGARAQIRGDYLVLNDGLARQGQELDTGLNLYRISITRDF